MVKMMPLSNAKWYTLGYCRLSFEWNWKGPMWEKR